MLHEHGAQGLGGVAEQSVEGACARCLQHPQVAIEQRPEWPDVSDAMPAQVVACSAATLVEIVSNRRQADHVVTEEVPELLPANALALLRCDPEPPQATCRLDEGDFALGTFVDDGVIAGAFELAEPG